MLRPSPRGCRNPAVPGADPAAGVRPRGRHRRRGDDLTLGRAFVVPRISDWTDRVRRLNGIVRALAAEHDAVLVDMADHPVNDRADLLSADRIHFAAAGQAVLAAEVVHALAATPGARRGSAA